MTIYTITESQRDELMRSLASRYSPTDWLAKLKPCAEIEKDAARYRWLRNTTNWASNSSGERIDVRNSPELWDSAIDEAIARAALLPDNAMYTAKPG